MKQKESRQKRQLGLLAWVVSDWGGSSESHREVLVERGDGIEQRYQGDSFQLQSPWGWATVHREVKIWGSGPSLCLSLPFQVLSLAWKTYPHGSAAGNTHGEPRGKPNHTPWGAAHTRCWDWSPCQVPLLTIPLGAMCSGSTRCQELWLATPTRNCD